MAPSLSPAIMNTTVVPPDGLMLFGRLVSRCFSTSTLSFITMPMNKTPKPAMMVVAGVADFSAHHFDEAHRSSPELAMSGAPVQAVFKLLLAHQPRSAHAALQAGFDLQLSGHTHGGQFWPWNHFVKLQQPFTAGLHKLQSLWVYTSRGTGYWGPPKRFGAPSEITLLRLIRG